MESTPLQTEKPNNEEKFFTEISLPSPQQRIFNGVKVPLVLKCVNENAKTNDVVDWISKNQAWIEKKILKHGGVLFRGFPLETASDFNQFVCSFKGWEDLSYTKSMSYAVRTKVEGRICTTNDGREGGLVFHHEQAQTPYWPGKVFFFCEIPAEEGGGTGICPSDIILQKLEEKFPEFVKQCEEKGVKYTAYLNADPDPSIGAGRGWKDFFSRKTKEEVEARMKSLNYTWEWLPSPTGEKNVLKCTSPQLTAVSVVPGSTKRVFFNQLIATVKNAEEWSKRIISDNENVESKEKGEIMNDGSECGNKRKSNVLDQNPKKRMKINMDRFVTLGDGSSIDFEALVFAKQQSKDCAVELEWQKGDVALLDNHAVMHARRLWTGDGPRRVLASLVAC